VSTQLDLTDNNGASLAVREIPTPLSIIAEAVRQGLDPDQLGKLMDLQERYERNEAAQQFAAALAKFQANCKPITKRRKIDLGGGSGPLYAGLDDIMREISPLLADCGLCVTFTTEMVDGGMVRTTCHVRHGRHVEDSVVTLPVPVQMRVNDTQKMGAALSYSKRYALCAALNITVTDEDTDANGLGTAVDEKQIAQLKEWFTASGEGEGPTLKWAQVKTVADIPAKQFPVIMERFKRKYATR
jgi:hypothetical protein